MTGDNKGEDAPLTYEATLELGRAEAEARLAAAGPQDLPLLLVSLPDMDEADWVEATCHAYLGHDDPWVANAAATALGHLARIHGRLDTEKAAAAIEAAKTRHPEMAGRMDDALGDIAFFMKT
ncbi:hypothetical protein [Parvularcula marina]|uniref:HEAT repeat domain-containing protein n=1 Tax=Parvularcula marina TaxID=2292771 RepID=A0A371RHU2_9PROT|nr:hypothetical protein [Parvularcula marina]RFB05011.1 hypothetical protein DX908_06730 [Parvularcula marina]